MRKRDDRFGREAVELLRRHLAPLRRAQRGPARILPPAPSAADLARYAASTPAERARVEELLVNAGFTRADLARGEVNEAPADDLTRQRARMLLRGRS